jgi:hypothetical protein
MLSSFFPKLSRRQKPQHATFLNSAPRGKEDIAKNGGQLRKSRLA